MKTDIAEEGLSKQGAAYTICYLSADDVEGVWEYINKLSQERTYIRFQGEKISLEDEEKHIQKKIREISENKSVVLLLLVDNKVHGICNIDLHDRTESHIASLGLSVDQTIRGQGLGKKLLHNSIEEAKKKLTGLRIITLEVKQPNTIAISLYKKFGFEQYGYLPQGTTHQDEFVDEVLMYKCV